MAYQTIDQFHLEPLDLQSIAETITSAQAATPFTSTDIRAVVAALAEAHGVDGLMKLVTAASEAAHQILEDKMAGKQP